MQQLFSEHQIARLLFAAHLITVQFLCTVFSETLSNLSQIFR